MKTKHSTSVEAEQPRTVETYWVLDVFGQNDKVKRKSRRPPSYNAEDYVTFLRRFCASGTNTNNVAALLYGNKTNIMEAKNNGKNNKNRNHQDSANDAEMSVKQPSDVSEVLRKLKQDLTVSFASFAKEFASDTCDGVPLLMDILRSIQMAQAELNGNGTMNGSIRDNRRSLLRRVAGDELECMQCLYQLCVANGQVAGPHSGIGKLAHHAAGFYGLALCLVSNVMKTRSIALQLLTAVCKMPLGHGRVSEALTTLRLNMGEPMRLKMFSGIVNSAATRAETLAESKNAESAEASLRFLVEAMAFLNAFTQSAADVRSKVVIQWEVEESGLNIHLITQVANLAKSPLALQLKKELAVWTDSTIDVTIVLDRLTNVTSTNDALRRDLQNLRTRLQELESEKRRFSDLERSLQLRCSELESELETLRSNSSKPASECDYQSVSCQTEEDFPSEEQTKLEEDDEFTIDDVLEELNNIVNSAESEMNSTESDLSKSDKDDVSSQEDLVVVVRKTPQPLPRPGSTCSDSKLQSIQLSPDLNGETSDSISSKVQRRNSRRSIRDNSYDAEAEISAADDAEESIRPDILKTIPSRAFQKPWNIVEARSPFYLEDTPFPNDISMLSRACHASMDSLARDNFMPSYMNGPPQSVLSRDERALSLGDLQVGDVFAFQSDESPENSPNFRNKNKRLSYDFEASRTSEKNKFGLSNLLPSFFKPKDQKTPSRDDWDFQPQERALMKDYRQNFQQRTPVRMQPMFPGDSYFWPATFQAMPFRNIPHTSIPIPHDRSRPPPLPSPTMLMQMHGITRIMDHPSGLY